MQTILDIFEELCREQHLPPTRQKDIKTAIRYLAASHDSTPERLAWTEGLEATFGAPAEKSPYGQKCAAGDRAILEGHACVSADPDRARTPAHRSTAPRRAETDARDIPVSTGGMALTASVPPTHGPVAQ
jgi:hypothetical protein